MPARHRSLLPYLVRGVLALLAVLSLATAASAAAASLEIAVVDQATGAPVAGAAVEVANADIGLRLAGRTNGQGKLRFEALSTAGGYLVSVAESERYYGIASDRIVLRSNVDKSVTLALAARSAEKAEISVTATRGVAAIDTVDAEVSSSLRQQEIEDLPVEGRDITRALYRLPNVTQATGFFPEAPNVSINGANSLYANYMIDGLDNNENFLGGEKFAAPVGLTREVTVLTNNYSTEFGRTGNGIINLTTRSGGNTLAGEAYVVNRPGPSLDASTPFAQRDLSGNQVKAGFQRDQGGFDLGGPLAKDRTFYFLDAEYTKDDKDNLLSVPQLGINRTVPGTNTFGLYSGKLDQRWTDAIQSTLRADVGRVGLERQGGGLDGGVTFPSAGNTQDRNSVLVASNNSFVGQDLVAETNVQYSSFRWNYARPANPSSPQTTVLDPSGETIAVLGNPGFVFDDLERTLQLQQKGIFTAGDHTVKAGLEVVSSNFALKGGGNPAGNYLVMLTQAQEDALKAKNPGAGLNVGDIPRDVQVLDYNVELRPASFGKTQGIYSGYAEDLYSLNPRLNVTFGLRYDYDTLSQGGARHGDTNNLAPRLAFNYQLTDRSSLRGGYGWFYDKIVYSVYSDALQQSTISDGFRRQIQELVAKGLLPSSTDLSRVFFDGNFGADFTSGVTYLNGPHPDPAQRQAAIAGTLRILNPDGYANPLTRQATLGYQLQLSRGLLFYADAVIDRSYDLFRLRDLNAPSAYTVDAAHPQARTPAEADATRPVAPVPGGAKSIVITEDKGQSRYEALSLNLVKDRGGELFAYRISYTLSSLRNNTEDINFSAADANDFNREWGPSINDRTHVINAILFLRPGADVTLSLAALVQSGQPVNRIPDARIYGTTDLNGDGASYGDAYDGNRDRSPGQTRNSDRLPWSKEIDLGVLYRPPFLGHRVELRADVFNLLNAVNLSGYSNNATQSNQIQVGPRAFGIEKKNAGPPRQYQFGVRYIF
jgi:outer membrane receptor for ferrienterochelin and colicin